MERLSRERFLEYIKHHEVEVIVDDGKGNRVISVRQPDTVTYSFTVMTCSHKAVITGDMGHFVFSGHASGDTLNFFEMYNPQYQQEKCVAGETERFDADAAKTELELLDVDTECLDFSGLHEFLLSCSYLSSEDFAEVACLSGSFNQLTFHFLWCCHAMKYVFDYLNHKNQAGIPT